MGKLVLIEFLKRIGLPYAWIFLYTVFASSVLVLVSRIKPSGVVILAVLYALLVAFVPVALHLARVYVIRRRKD